MAYTRILIEASGVQTSAYEGETTKLQDGREAAVETVVAGDMLCKGVGCSEVTKVTRFHYDNDNNLTTTVLSEAP